MLKLVVAGSNNNEKKERNSEVSLHRISCLGTHRCINRYSSLSCPIRSEYPSISQCKTTTDDSNTDSRTLESHLGRRGSEFGHFGSLRVSSQYEINHRGDPNSATPVEMCAGWGGSPRSYHEEIEANLQGGYPKRRVCGVCSSNFSSTIPAFWPSVRCIH